MKRIALAAALCVCALDANAADPWADTVVSFTQGTGASASFANAQAALGAPTATAGITAPAFSNTQVVSLGLGGVLVLGFNEAIANDPLNPFGVDFIIFGNSFFTTSGGTINGAFTEPVQTIWVSRDNITYYQLATTRGADDLFPTQGSGDSTLPVNPALTLADFTGKTTADALGLYAGSAGGTPFDIDWARDGNGDAVLLSDISYVKIVNTSSTVTGEIDAVADVTPVPEPQTLALLAIAGGALALYYRKR